MTKSEQMIEDLKNSTRVISSMTSPPVMDPYAPPKSVKRDPLLAERQTTHGDFSENARIAQAIKTTIVQAEGYERVNNTQREALDLIATKIGRILSGRPNFNDHWDDIAGYAKLGSQACE